MAITLINRKKISRKKEDNGLRPLKPSRDLVGVADLIEEAFGEDLDRSGRAALREMRWMGRLGIVLLWFDFFGSDVNTYLNGFVWTDQGQIVGNATVSRNLPEDRQWFISNVAVAKTHRGRGIGRQLMNAAIEFVKEMRGRSVALHVRQRNIPAVRLYESMNFNRITATTFFYTPRVGGVKQVPIPNGLTMREHNLDEGDARAVYALFRAAIPINVQMERPLYQSTFRLGAEVTFSNFWRGLVGLGRARHWVVEEIPGKFVGTLSVQPGAWNTEHKLSFIVHPDWQGKLEEPLISTALTYLKSCPARSVALQHSEDHPAGIQALQAFGFRVKHTHIWMKLVL
jgi:ribosomal protein S18 acetylase RimI-like enzyme